MASRVAKLDVGHEAKAAAGRMVKTAAGRPRKLAQDAPVRSPGRPVGDHDARRADILAAARGVIAAEGYAGATVRRVAQAAGCSTGVLTYYFAGKDDLIGAVVDDLFAESEADLVETADGGFDLRAFLERVLLTRAPQGASAWHVWCHILVRAGTEPGLAARFATDYQRFRARFAHLLGRAQARGTLRATPSAERLADLLSALIDGWLVMRPLEARRLGKAQMQRLIDDTLALLAP